MSKILGKDGKEIGAPQKKKESKIVSEKGVPIESEQNKKYNVFIDIVVNKESFLRGQDMHQMFFNSLAKGLVAMAQDCGQKRIIIDFKDKSSPLQLTKEVEFKLSFFEDQEGEVEPIEKVPISDEQASKNKEELKTAAKENEADDGGLDLKKDVEETVVNIQKDMDDEKG